MNGGAGQPLAGGDGPVTDIGADVDQHGRLERLQPNQQSGLPIFGRRVLAVAPGVHGLLAKMRHRPGLWVEPILHELAGKPAPPAGRNPGEQPQKQGGGGRGQESCQSGHGGFYNGFPACCYPGWRPAAAASGHQSPRT